LLTDLNPIHPSPYFSSVHEKRKFPKTPQAEKASISAWKPAGTAPARWSRACGNTVRPALAQASKAATLSSKCKAGVEALPQHSQQLKNLAGSSASRTTEEIDLGELSAHHA